MEKNALQFCFRLAFRDKMLDRSFCFACVRVTAPQNGRRSRPETPILKWKIEDEGRRGKDDGEVQEDEAKEEGGWRVGQKGRKSAISARKLAVVYGDCNWRRRSGKNVRAFLRK